MSRSRPHRQCVRRGCTCTALKHEARRARERIAVHAIPDGLADHEIDRWGESGEWAWDEHRQELT